MKKLSLYIHIPFCIKKCYYCDFVSYVVKNDSDLEDYIDVLCKEIESYKTENLKFKTVYFGGGTPSILPVKLIKKVINKIEKYFSLGEEISIEVNPGTVDSFKLKEYKTIGFNRISIGAQSLNDEILRLIGRIHITKDIYNTYNKVIKYGFDNINLDLIYGLPKQTLKDWEQTLNKLIEISPKHLSLYCLDLSKKTLFFESVKYYLPNEDTIFKMYKLARKVLTSNKYIHYEISNFAKKNYKCKHNINYWLNKEFIGVGVSAHSYYKKTRYYNTSSLKKYLLNDGKNNFNLFQTQELNEEVKDTILLNLRLLQTGINLQKFKKRFSIDIFSLYNNQISELINKKLLIKKDNSLKLSSKAVFISNEVFERFI